MLPCELGKHGLSVTSEPHLRAASVRPARLAAPRPASSCCSSSSTPSVLGLPSLSLRAASVRAAPSCRLWSSRTLGSAASCLDFPCLPSRTSVPPLSDLRPKTLSGKSAPKGPFPAQPPLSDPRCAAFRPSSPVFPLIPLP